MKLKSIMFLLVFSLLASISACGGGSSAAPPPPPPGSGVTLCTWDNANWDNCNWQ